MTEEEKHFLKAVHLKGGNYFDDLRIDINQSHQRFDSLVLQKKRINKPAVLNWLNYLFNGFLQKYKLQELLVTTGLKRKWFDDFYRYWREVLNGRPLTISDFLMLLHDYRKKQQFVSELNWETPTAHVNNWQNPIHIYATLSNTRKLALYPLVGRGLWKHIPKRASILEYGCSLAPYYHCYRAFFSHLQCHWILADIPNFPFHYAKYLYQDEGVKFITIAESDFRNPLKEESGFDVIILTTVLEHLDDPLEISDYLLDRLKPNGLFVFDYIISEGKGLDTPKALEMRAACLRRILERVELIQGKVHIPHHVGLCIGRKRA